MSGGEVAGEPWVDEVFGPDGLLERGRCDTCGAPCGPGGCTVDVAHVVAIL